MLNIVIGIFFSLVGFAACRWGKKAENMRVYAIGWALMLYPYFTPDFGWTSAIGILLSIGIFYPAHD